MLQQITANQETTKQILETQQEMLKAQQEIIKAQQEENTKILKAQQDSNLEFFNFINARVSTAAQ